MPITSLLLLSAFASDNLVLNPGFDQGSNSPTHYDLKGAAKWEAAGYADEFTSPGIALDSSAAEASVAQVVKLRPEAGKWVTFRFRGRAENGFGVAGDQLFMEIEFLRDGGTKPMESAKRLIYREVLRDRKDFAVNGNDGKSGGAAWRTYELEELLPFKEVDAVRVTVGFKNGAAISKPYCRFLVDDFSVTQAGGSAFGKQDPAESRRPPSTAAPDEKSLVHLGGRWYYLPGLNEPRTDKVTITYRNANRLFYRDARWTNPFRDNMTSWLRPGHLDAAGRRVTQEQFVGDNLVVSFEGNGYVKIVSKNLPNHPTAKFPDTYGTQGYNPNSIQEQAFTFWLPLEPKRREGAVHLPSDGQNTGALPMGPIGIAVNGVIFFNPYDMGSVDASGIMDRCCGHPAQDNAYHYHKYPICVNTPFVDKGEDHSPLIGFAFDGFPVYGPYESAGTLARDVTQNRLDGFNAHFGEAHGWHYHVSPGKFPYIIGGYMGTATRWRPNRRG